MEKTPSTLTTPGDCDTTSSITRVTTLVFDQPLTWTGPLCIGSDLRERLEIWVNEGGAGGEVSE